MEVSDSGLTSPKSILQKWESSHFELSPEQRVKFLAKVRQLGLTSHSSSAISAAIRENRKLEKVAEILSRKERLRPGPRSKASKSKIRSAAQSTKVGAASNSYRYSPAREVRKDPRTDEPHGTRVGGLSGTAGASARYSSGMVRNPGMVEMAIGERCSQCGAFVPSGAAHDCS